MATRTLLAGNRTLTTESREEHHARLMEPHRRIDQGVQMPQANLYIGGPADKLDDAGLRPELRHLPDHAQNTLYGKQNTNLAYPLGNVNGARTGSIPDQMDQSRRTSELQPISGTRIIGGESPKLPFSDTEILLAVVCVVALQFN